MANSTNGSLMARSATFGKARGLEELRQRLGGRWSRLTRAPCTGRLLFQLFAEHVEARNSFLQRHLRFSECAFPTSGALLWSRRSAGAW